MSYLLIIGAKSDIAKAVARKFSQMGFDLYLAARGADELESFANDIVIRTQRSVKCLELDILDYESHEAFYNSLEEKPFGVLSAAGYLGNQLEAQRNFSEAAKIIATNYTGVVNLLNIFANGFEKRKSGFIIGISSVAGDRGRKSNYFYGSAKAGLTTYLSGLRNRLHSSNIQVVTVKPGFVATKMTEMMDLPEKLTAQPQEVAEDIYRAHIKGKSMIYTKWFWKWIMLIIRSIPEWIFKKMSL